MRGEWVLGWVKKLLRRLEFSVVIFGGPLSLSLLSSPVGLSAVFFLFFLRREGKFKDVWV